jgi:2-(1,2-epoxy-1,2-dihydrophenyl)acetyl-CoA isomerase
MAFETIQVEPRGSVTVITLNRPTALNAFTVQMGNELKAAVNQAVEAGARALIVTGAGRAFSAGGDLREMQRIAEQEGRLEAFFDKPLRLLNDCVLALRKAPVPIIAAVNGPAFGAGCNFALACDLVIAGESASFSQAFVNIGLSPDCGGTFILPRLIGFKRATYLLMTGERVDAKRAEQMGMINAVVPDDELMNESLKLAEKLANGPTAAMARIKELMETTANNDYAGQLDNEHRAQLLSGQTGDFKEGVAAFVEKRPPKFTGS